MHLTLRQLRLFEAVVRTGGVSAAAREMHCTQPSVSIQLKQISEQVGLPLFDGHKPLRLSQAGEALYQAARRMADTWEDFADRIHDLRGLQSGRLRLAVVSTAKYFVPGLLAPFCARYPGIEVSLEIGNRAQIAARLRQGLDDLTIMSRPPTDMALDALPFLDNPLVLIAPTGHALAQADPPIDVAQLQAERFLLREAGSGTRMAIDAWLQACGLQLNIKMEIGSNEAIKLAVQSGLGLSILSRHALRDTPGLVELPCVGFPLPSAWKIVMPARQERSLVTQRFIEHLLAARGNAIP